jgi:rod shape-determining protein MreC
MVAFRNTDTSGRTTGLLFRCVLYSLLALGLIIFDKRYDHLGHIRRFLSIVAYPVQIAVASPFEGWDWFRESVSSRETLRADKAKLEAELRLADFRLQRYEALEAESQRLRALRDNTAGVTDRFLVGDIMDLDIDAFRERVLVDKGAHDGVFVGQAVLDSGGVFGQVARVEQMTSEVILVSDAAHAIPVQVNRNGLRTIAVGTGAVNRLKLPYLATSADVVAGDLLVTSGLGGVFPAGYPVGTVAEVKRDPAQSLADVDVRPAAALDRSRELMFIWLKPDAAAGATAAAAAGASVAAGAKTPAIATPGKATVAGPSAASGKASASPPATPPGKTPASSPNATPSGKASASPPATPARKPASAPPKAAAPEHPGATNR